MSLQPSRRLLLKCALGGAVTLALNSRTATAASAIKKRERCVLRLANTHTHEQLNVLYKYDGQYIPQSLDRLDYHLRDHRQNEARVMDPELFDQLYEIQRLLGSKDTFEIISGYRSMTTNEMLRRTSSGVAKNSYHVKGQALDIRLQNTPLSDLRQAAIDLQAGGVGIYSGSNFVHIDTGPVRHWGS
ncbi:MAG: DUF882 domain-containing protein [Gammaproteobacteria bacterium]|nr:DUF882 domain-containing protein [Gammaproteobacteria bacterium]